MENLSFKAPAKLNLMLHITGRRADGYHELQTVFQLIDLCDEIRFEKTQQNEILLHDLPQLVATDNLILKAAHLMKDFAKDYFGLKIFLQKNIPMQAGLGGGSSDAATTMIALNKLWRCELSQVQLLRLAKQLGADVPIFVYGKNAFAEGVGDELYPIQLPNCWYLIVDPLVAVSTQKIFQDPNLLRSHPKIKRQDVSLQFAENDCLPVVLKNYPQVNQAFLALNQLAPAKLTGTGGCLFATFTDAAKAIAAKQALSSQYRVYLVRSLELNPTQV